MKLRLPSKLLAALMATMLIPSTFADDSGKTLNLYILTGQSNSLGVYYSDRLTDAEIAAYSTAGNGDIKLWNGNTNSGGGYISGSADPRWITVAEGSYNGNGSMGPEYGFAYMMNKKAWNTSGNNDVAIIKVSCDGGSNDRWTASNNFYKGMLAHVVEAIKGIDASQYSRINIAGLLYLQGETVDSSDQYKQAASRYDAFLTQLKSDLKDAGYSEALVNKLVIDDASKILTETVAGEPASWANADKTAQSSKGANELMTLSGTRSDMGWVFTRDLDKTTGDSHGVHYTQKAQLTIGARYAYAMALTHNATNPGDQWEIGTVRNDRYDGCGEYPAVEGTAYGATAGQHYSLNDAAAWWNGAAPGANDVITWDVSSANQRNGETISAGLSVKGILIEDPYSPTITINNVEGGNHTLSTGTAGITLQGSNLTVNTAFSTTADQTWTVAAGKSLELNGAMGGDHAVSISGAGASVSIMGLGAEDSHTWTVGDNVNLTLGAAGESATISSLTLGSGDTLDLGGKSTQNLTITNLQATQGATFQFNLARTDVYDRLTLGSASSLAGDIVFNIAVGSGVRGGGTFTLVDGWIWGDDFTSNITGVGHGTTGSFGVQNGALVFTLTGAADQDYTHAWQTGATEVSISNNGFNNVCVGVQGHNVKITSTTVSTSQYPYVFTTSVTDSEATDMHAELDSNVRATWVGAVGGSGWSSRADAKGNKYMRITGTGTQTYTDLFGALNAVLDGNAYLEFNAANAKFKEIMGVSQSEIKGSLTMLFKAGTFNGTVVGGANHDKACSSIQKGVYMQIDGGTFGEKNGSTVTGGVIYGGSAKIGDWGEVPVTILGGTHMLVKGGQFNNFIYGGNAGGTGQNNKAVLEGGVQMIISGGRFDEFVHGGNAAGGTIRNTAKEISDYGVDITVTGDAVFASDKGIAGGNGTGGTIENGINMLISGGTLADVYGGNNGGGTINGGINLTIEGGTFGSNIVSGAGKGGTINGDVVLTISGGDFSAMNQSEGKGVFAGSAGGGTAIDGNTKVVLKDMDGENEFVSGATKYTGVMSGKHLADATATISGTATLELDNYTADAVYATLRDFDKISAVNGTTTTFGTDNRGGTNNFSIDSTSTINLTNANANLGTLSGAGRAVVAGTGGGASTAFALAEDWTGTVALTQGQIGNLYDFNKFGHAGSTIELDNLGLNTSGQRQISSDSTKTFDADFKLVTTSGAGDWGLFLQRVEAGETYTFNGAWSGSGNFEMRQDSEVNDSATFLFMGDMSAFSGKYIADSAITLQFGNGGTGLDKTAGSVSGTGEIKGKSSAAARMLTVDYNYSNDVTVANTITGNTTVVKDGAGTLILTGDNTYTGGTTINSGKIHMQSLGTVGTGDVTLAQGAQLVGNNFTLTGGSTETVFKGDGTKIWADSKAAGKVDLGDGAELSVGSTFALGGFSLGTDAKIKAVDGGTVTLSSISDTVYGNDQFVMGNGDKLGTFAIAKNQTLKTLNNDVEYDYKGTTDSASISGSHGYGISLGNYYQTFNGLEITSAASSVDIYAKVTDSAMSAAGKGVVVKGHSGHDSIYTFTDVTAGSFWIAPDVKNLTISGNVDLSGKLTNQNSIVTIGGTGTTKIGGQLSLWNDATFKITDGRDLGSVNLDNTNGALIIIENGSMTLSESVSIARTKDSNADGYGNLRLGGSGTTGTVKIANGKTLTYDNNTVKVKACNDAASISGSGGAEISVWNKNQSFKNVEVTLSASGRVINADMESSVLNLDGGGTHELDNLSSKARTMAALNINDATATVKADQNVTLTDDSTFEGSYIINANGKSLTIEKSVTLGASGSIQSAATDPGVVIRSKGSPRLMLASALEDETPVASSTTPKVTNVVITDSAITGGEGDSSISNALISLGAGTKELSGLTLDNTVISLAENSKLALDDVVFSANSSVEGGTVSTGNITQKVSQDSIISTSVTGSGDSRAVNVTLANNILGNIGSFESLTLDLDWSFISSLAYGNMDADASQLVLTFSGMSAETGLFSGTEGQEVTNVAVSAPAPFAPVTVSYGEAANGLVLTLNSPVPEPATGALSVLALAALAARRRRKH